MTNAMNLNNFGFTELTNDEVITIDGGGVKDFIVSYVVGKVIDVMIPAIVQQGKNNWSHIVTSLQPPHVPYKPNNNQSFANPPGSVRDFRLR